MKKISLFVITLLFIFLTISCRKGEINHEGRVYYEIFVRAFADSNNDGIGDFNGITQKLDYLEDLGVKGIWLMPIYPSPSYHGYDITDYKNVNSQYGTISDFEKLLKEAHKRDIKVIIDFVINHTSTKHPWFIGAKDENSPYRDYYRFKDRTEPKTGPWYNNSINGGSNSDYYYGFFWDQMPDLNFDNKKVIDEMENIAKFWLKKGVDGFRFDAALHIFTQDELETGDILLNENTGFWKEFQKRLQKIKDDVYLVGEVWTTQSTVAAFYQGLDSNFNFDISERILTTVGKGGDRNYTKEIKKMYDTIESFSSSGVDAPFLSNHDQTRVATKLNNNMTYMKLASEMYLTLKGNPFIYYGEEIGMKGDKPDEYIRLPFKWSDDKKDLDTKWVSSNINDDLPSLSTQINDPNSLYNVYKTLIHLRNDHKALSQGSFTVVKTTKANPLMFMRISDKEALLVVHNLANSDYSLTLDENNLSIIYESLHNKDKDLLTLAPKSTKIYQVPYKDYQKYLEY